MNFWKLFLAGVLSLSLLGCAPRRPVRNDFAAGIVGRAVWPCKLNQKTAMVKCDCLQMAMSVDAKTGTTVLRCTKNSAK